jgi:DNA adenine methylase
MLTPTRPIIRYHGGKWKLAPWIISHFPRHRVYIEPFGGAASVLLQKARSEVEIYSELDNLVFNLFRVVRERGQELLNALRLTPFAREEFERAWESTDDELEMARRIVIRSSMGRDSASATKEHQTTFRAYAGSKRTSTVNDWINYPAALELVIERLRGVMLENRDAIRVMNDYDGSDALHYVDPPYLSSTRDSGRDYRHELDDAEHYELIDAIRNLKGMVLLSGYDNKIYSNLLSDWKKVSCQAIADGGVQRTEVLWISPSAVHAGGAQMELSV